MTALTRRSRPSTARRTRPTRLAQTVYIDGLDSLVRAFGKIDRGLRRELQTRLKHAGEIVALDYKMTAPRKTGKMADSAKPSIRGGSVYIRVTAKKQSPKYPSGYRYPNRVEYESGSNQPLHQSLERTRPAVLRDLDHVVDWVADEFGKGI